MLPFLYFPLYRLRCPFIFLGLPVSGKSSMGPFYALSVPSLVSLAQPCFILWAFYLREAFSGPFALSVPPLVSSVHSVLRQTSPEYTNASYTPLFHRRPSHFISVFSSYMLHHLAATKALTLISLSSYTLQSHLTSAKVFSVARRPKLSANSTYKHKLC